jgi:hypothetical protein
MKVLYAIQGTGNGHLSRAREIIPILQNQVETLDLLVSGAQHQVEYEHEIKYRFKGSFCRLIRAVARGVHHADNFPAQREQKVFSDGVGHP